MNTQQAVENRIRKLCKERGITPNAISNISGVPQATVKSILNGETFSTQLCKHSERIYKSHPSPQNKSSLPRITLQFG